jgi:hypothetical protein
LLRCGHLFQLLLQGYQFRVKVFVLDANRVTSNSGNLERKFIGLSLGVKRQKLRLARILRHSSNPFLYVSVRLKMCFNLLLNLRNATILLSKCCQLVLIS